MLCTGCSLSDQNILLTINPQYNDFVSFMKIYSKCSEIQAWVWKSVQLVHIFVNLTKSVFLNFELIGGKKYVDLRKNNL